MSVGLHRAHHNFAGVDPDADLDGRASLLKELAAAAEIIARYDCCMNRSLRMILVRDRCAELREDAVASRLHDVAVILMNRVDHQLNAGSTTARASSGSRSAINSVEPLILANSSVTVLRSPSSGGPFACSAAQRT